MTENRNQTPNLIYQGTDEYYGRMGYASAMAIAGGDDPIKPKAQGGGGGGESAPNSTFTMRGDDVSYKTLFNEFTTGKGPEYSGFGENHPMTKDMQKSIIVTMAISNYVAGGKKPLINYDVPFGLINIPLASQSMTEQFVGGARVSIIPTPIGTAFIINNSTGWYSASYHMQNDVNRVSGQTTPYGTIYQRFMWIQK